MSDSNRKRADSTNERSRSTDSGTGTDAVGANAGAGTDGGAPDAGGANTAGGGRDPDASMDTRDRDDGTKLTTALAAIVGLWVLASPFVYETTETMQWNAIIVGVLVAAIAGYNFFKRTDAGAVNTAAASVTALLGLWLLASPFVLETASEAMEWSAIVSGLVIAALGAYNAYRGSQHTRTTAERPA